MKILRKIGATVVLTSVLAVSALAGEIPTPPCANPAPGQIDTPPCAAAPGDMETPALTSTFGDVGTPMVANDEMSFSKIATDVFLYYLPLF